MALELKVNTIRSYYDVLESVGASVAMPAEQRDAVMRKYAVSTENEQLGDTLRYVDFGYSLSSV